MSSSLNPPCKQLISLCSPIIVSHVGIAHRLPGNCRHSSEYDAESLHRGAVGPMPNKELFTPRWPLERLRASAIFKARLGSHVGEVSRSPHFHLLYIKTQQEKAGV